MTTPLTSGHGPADAGAALQHKTFDVEFKSLEDDGSFSLYACVFDVLDLQGDIIVPGAVKNCDALVRDGWGALNHRNSDLPISYPTAVVQDSHGLLISGVFHSTPAAQECRTVVRERKNAGKSVKCSIGYAVDDYEMVKRDGRTVRLLKSILVYEWSIVNLAANPVAELVSAKGHAPAPHPETDEMSESEKGVVAALKRALGIDTKRSVAISAANRARINEHMEAVSNAHDEHDKCLKDMGECHEKCMKSCKSSMAAMDEMKSYMKGFEPTTTDEDEEDEAASPGPGKGRGKDDDPDETASADGKALAVYRDQLRSRAVAGRAMLPRP